MAESAQNAPSSAKRVALTINGQKVEAPVGASVLDAAVGAGIDIPTLCAHQDLEGFGACRLCVVELVRGQKSRVVASCLYPVEEGLVVETETPRIRKHRKIVLELMSAHWPWVPDELMARYGADKHRFDDQGTFCILCGNCVRWCAERKNEHALGFVGRGTARQVVLHSDIARRVCPECGGGEMECLRACPTGVIANEFVGAVSGAVGKAPIVGPIRFMDADNDRAVAQMVGDRGKK